MTSYTFSIDFPRWKVLPYDSFRSKVVLLAKRNMLRDLRDHSERFKWSREQAQNLSLHIFFLIIIIIIRCSGMFRDVPECSGMFHVPGFIDGPVGTAILTRNFNINGQSGDKTRNMEHSGTSNKIKFWACSRDHLECSDWSSDIMFLFVGRTTLPRNECVQKNFPPWEIN